MEIANVFLFLICLKSIQAKQIHDTDVIIDNSVCLWFMCLVCVISSSGCLVNMIYVWFELRIIPAAAVKNSVSWVLSVVPDEQIMLEHSWNKLIFALALY